MPKTTEQELQQAQADMKEAVAILLDTREQLGKIEKRIARLERAAA